MGVKHIYEIYDGNKLIFTGFPNEILAMFGGDPATNLMHYAKTKGMYRRKYIVKVGESIGDADRNIWDITLDGKRVFTGTDRKIAERFGLTTKFRGSLYHKRHYKINHIYNVEPHKADREEVPSDPLYDQTFRHLMQYHNTGIYAEKDRIIKKLKQNGINVEATLMSDKQGWVLWQVSS